MTLAQARHLVREGGDFAALLRFVPYAAWLGLRLQQREPPVLGLPYREALIGNPRLPALHGGVVAGFMESAALLQLLLALEQERLPKSIDFSIDYLRSARPEDSYAAGEITRLGRRVAQVQVRCWQADASRPVALARAHFLLTPDSAGTAP
jgi:uncharacterized protein (TIGR00369 family)